VHCTHRLLSELGRILCKRHIIFCGPPAFTVSVATFARRNKCDWRRRCRCRTAKQSNSGNRERSHPRHCAQIYHFVMRRTRSMNHRAVALRIELAHKVDDHLYPRVILLTVSLLTAICLYPYH